jgi:hypothetical protein
MVKCYRNRWIHKEHVLGVKQDPSGQHPLRSFHAEQTILLPAQVGAGVHGVSPPLFIRPAVVGIDGCPGVDSVRLQGSGAGEFKSSVRSGGGDDMTEEEDRARKKEEST